MRIIKEADIRKAEILDAAEEMFQEKGYSKTTTEDILKKTGIARGTLYYHFKSKEDILSAMIERQIERRKKLFKQIAEDNTISVVEKLFHVIQLQANNGMLAEGLHEKENIELHQRSFNRSLLCYAPVLTEIVEQGIKSGEFSTPYPAESVELLFCASQLHDPGVFKWTPKERRRKKKAFFWMLEITLGISHDAKERLYQLAGLSQEVFENNE